MRKFMILLTTLIFLIATTGAANAIFFDSKTFFLEKNPGLDLIDFEGIVDSGFVPLPDEFSDDVTFEGSNLFVADGLTNGAPSDWLINREFGAPISMTFTASIQAVGFNIATNYESSVTHQTILKLYNGTSLIDKQTIKTTKLEEFDTFVGWSDLGSFDKVTVELNPKDFANIDNLYYGTPVPEPATLLLVGAGLIGIASAHRKMKKK